MATGQVSYGSDLERRGWVKDKLLEERHKQFWLPYTGNSSNSVIYSKTKLDASAGHTIVFDYTGKLTGKMFKGQDYGDINSEIKRKFSDKIVIDEFSLYVDNGSDFEGCNIDDLTITQHDDSISKLRDLFYRHNDQAKFDTLQGVFEPPTHIYNMGDSVTYNKILKLTSVAKRGEDLVKPTSNGAVGTEKAKKRIPLDRADSTNAGTSYFLVADESTALKLKSDPNYQVIKYTGDVRGNNNSLFTGVIGKLNGVLIVEAPVFFGYSPKGKFGVGDTEIQYAGLRRYAVKGSTMAWEGQAKFDELVELKEGGDTAVKIYSRNLLLGSGAMQVAFGKLPDYKLQWSKFEKTSESMLEFWADWKKTKLTLESGKDYKGKVVDIDFGVIAVDVEI